MSSNILFFLLSGLVLYGGLRVITHKNLVSSALHLAGSMLALAGLFFILGAHFIAGVQVVVYAGAVMVLFVMVVMLFDLEAQPENLWSAGLWHKSGVVFFFTGFIAGLLPISLHLFKPLPFKKIIASDTKDLAYILFSKYILDFEALGILLLLIAVGAATICRKGNK